MKNLFMHRRKFILHARQGVQRCSMHDAAVSSGLGSGDFLCMSTTDEIFSVVNKSLSVYPSKGNDNCNISSLPSLA